MIIRSKREYLRFSKQLSGFRQMRKRVEKMIESYELDDDRTLTYIDGLINEIVERSENYEEISRDNNDYVEQTKTMELFDQLPQFLLKARLSLGWSQSELARQAGLTPPQICRYERTSYRSVSLSRAIEIATVLQNGLESKAQTIQALRKKQSDARSAASDILDCD